MKITALMNDGEGRFWEHNESDLLRVGPTLTVDAPDINTALNRAFEIGNLDTVDDEGKAWPHDTTRSLSTGDILVVDASEGEITAHAVDHFGFKPVPLYVVIRGLAFGKPDPRGLGSFKSDQERK